MKPGYGDDTLTINVTLNFFITYNFNCLATLKDGAKHYNQVVVVTQKHYVGTSKQPLVNGH